MRKCGRFEHVRVSYTRQHTGVLLRYTCHVCATHRQRLLCAHRCTHPHTLVMEGISTTAGTLEEGAVAWQVRRRTHSHVMEGICTAGSLEEGEVVWQVRTRTSILHTQTHRSTAALPMYVPHRESPVNVYRKSWSPQSSSYRSAVGTFRCMVCVCKDSAAARGGGTP